MRRIARKLNEKYGQGTVELEIKESYRNMRSQIEGCMEIIDWAKEATRMAGLTPKDGCHPRMVLTVPDFPLWACHVRIWVPAVMDFTVLMNTLPLRGWMSAQILYAIS